MQSIQHEPPQPLETITLRADPITRLRSYIRWIQFNRLNPFCSARSFLSCCKRAVEKHYAGELRSGALRKEVFGDNKGLKSPEAFAAEFSAVIECLLVWPMSSNAKKTIAYTGFHYWIRIISSNPLAAVTEPLNMWQTQALLDLVFQQRERRMLRYADDCDDTAMLQTFEHISRLFKESQARWHRSERSSFQRKYYEHTGFIYKHISDAIRPSVISSGQDGPSDQPTSA